MAKPTNQNTEHVADGSYVRWSYEQLLLRQPHVPVGGLWTDGTWFYAVCPALQNAVSMEGEPIEKWFNQNGKAVGAPIRLVTTVPPGTVAVPERRIDERISLIGAPLTARDVLVQLSLRLPRDFPAFDFDAAPPRATLHVARKLTSFEEEHARETASPYLGRMSLDILVDTPRFSRPLGFRQSAQGDLTLIPSRRLPRGLLSQQARALIERDEDFWVERSHTILGTDVRTPDLPDLFQPGRSRCIFDASVHQPGNLRTSLALYEQVFLGMPLASEYGKALAGLRVTEDDLLHLAATGRLAFLMPQSIERYPLALVQRLADLDQEVLLPSRRLAAALLTERRRRIPLLHAPLSTQDRRHLLAAIAGVTDPRLKGIAQTLTSEFARTWSSGEERLHFEGAMGLLSTGIGQITAAMVKTLFGRELNLELWHAGVVVEWGAALAATVIPFQGDGYSEEGHVELLASSYSGVVDQPIPTRFGEVDIAVDGLFSIDNDASIEAFAKVFSGRDVDRIRNLVFSITDRNFAAESINAAVRDFNDKVSRYERHMDRLARLDWVRLAAALAAPAAAAGATAAVAYVPLGVWLAHYLVKGGDPSRDFGGAAFDFLRAANSWTSRDVVLVSRMRKALKPT